MESKVNVAGHPVHPMLIVFPLGLLATASVFTGLLVALGVLFRFRVRPQQAPAAEEVRP